MNIAGCGLIIRTGNTEGAVMKTLIISIALLLAAGSAESASIFATEEGSPIAPVNSLVIIGDITDGD